MNDIVIYGFGGFGREVACLLKILNEKTPTWNLIGYIDDGVAAGAENRYGKVLGGIEYLNNYASPLSVVISIANPKVLRGIVAKLHNPLLDFPNIIAPNVNVFDKDAFSIGKGNIVFWGCRLSCDVRIGDFNLINGAVSLGHDVTLHNFNVLGPSTRLSGSCCVGDENQFGVGSIVLQGIKIGNNTKIGIGSVVIRNTADDAFYFGNPAKNVKEEFK